MGLINILATIWVVHRNTPSAKLLFFKESWTSEDVRGYAASDWQTTTLARYGGPIAIVAGALMIITRLVILFTTPAEIGPLKA
jgi:hypothetical protein